MELYKKYKTLFDKYKVNTPKRIAFLMGQLEHESGLKPISENLNYSEQGLLKTFSKYFNQDTAKLYAKKPEKIANRVYANRGGNGNEASGDGWRYRGRGYIQVTLKNNYLQLSKDTGVDYVKNPDLLLNEADAMISALWYWGRIDGNKFADNNDYKGVTKAINGGYNGLEDRIKKIDKWKKLLGI